VWGLERVGRVSDRAQERICCMAERNFIARLAPSEERDRLQKINGRYLSAGPEFWSDASMAKHRAAWRARQPRWRRAFYDIAEFLLRGHAAARFSASASGAEFVSR
jgi:hypothetical protein